MTAIEIPTVELIPPRRQALWGKLAVANFALGGLGSGFYLAAVAAAGFERTPALTAASWLAPTLVLAGFAAVATEAGHPLRGLRVLMQVRTSWMSRELWLGGVFVLLAAADLLFPLRLHRIQAMAAAAALALAQGFILRRARGVAAWDVPIMPLVFLVSALVSGSGLYMLVELAGGRALGAGQLGTVLILLVAGFFVWVRYLLWSLEGPFAGAVRPLTHGRASLVTLGGGYVGPFLLVALALAAPILAPLTLSPAGGLMIIGQLYAKTLLILTAGELRPISLANLEVKRRPS